MSRAEPPRPARTAAQRLAAHARSTLERAEALALRLHADEVVPEHWLAALLEDEDCAATRIVLHAFADPATIGAEVLALCPGIMVVGSGRTLPFSVRGVRALRAARRGAAARGADTLEVGDLFTAACAELELRARERLEPLAGVALGAGGEPDPASGGQALSAEGTLFRNYSPAGLRALGASARAAGGLGRAAIAPAHLLLGALEVDEGLRARTGLTASRARLALSGQDEDPTPLSPRPLPWGSELETLVAALPEGSETSAVLGWLLERGKSELVLLLQRQKVTPALYARCRTSFRDP